MRVENTLRLLEMGRHPVKKEPADIWSSFEIRLLAGCLRIFTYIYICILHLLVI